MPALPQQDEPQEQLESVEESYDAEAASRGRHPLLRLEIRDLNHDGSKVFLKHLNASDAIEGAVQGVLRLLYGPRKGGGSSTTEPPATRSVTVVLRDMDGVAYTTGIQLDSDHKEIHFSTRYIAGISATRQRDEMLGVLRHEMVHCYQWDGQGKAPGGLIEGVADWVRLKSGLVPPHWKQTADGSWDAGYQTTGYFLEYLEQRFGDGTVRKLNRALKNKYIENQFWTDLFGADVQTLWTDYGKALKKKKKEGYVDSVYSRLLQMPSAIVSGVSGLMSTAESRSASECETVKPTESGDEVSSSGPEEPTPRSSEDSLTQFEDQTTPKTLPDVETLKLT